MIAAAIFLTLLAVLIVLSLLHERQRRERAEGERLDRWAQCFGLRRKAGETNAQLRERVSAWMEHGNRATPRALELAALNVDGVDRVTIVEPSISTRDHSRVGEVDVYLTLRAGLDEEERNRVLAEAWDALDEQRPAHVRVTLQVAA